jgi:hypothetical protein
MRFMCDRASLAKTLSFEKILPARQVNSPQARIGESSSRNAVNFSFARTTKRFPSSRCASTIQIVRLLMSHSWEKIGITAPSLARYVQKNPLSE